MSHPNLQEKIRSERARAERCADLAASAMTDKAREIFFSLSAEASEEAIRLERQLPLGMHDEPNPVREGPRKL